MTSKSRWLWIVEYGCGCSDDAPLRRELLDYCGKHGNDAKRYHKLPREDEDEDEDGDDELP